MKIETAAKIVMKNSTNKKSNYSIEKFPVSKSEMGNVFIVKGKKTCQFTIQSTSNGMIELYRWGKFIFRGDNERELEMSAFNACDEYFTNDI